MRWPEEVVTVFMKDLAFVNFNSFDGGGGIISPVGLSNPSVHSF